MVGGRRGGKLPRRSKVTRIVGVPRCAGQASMAATAKMQNQKSKIVGEVTAHFLPHTRLVGI